LRNTREHERERSRKQLVTASADTALVVALPFSLSAMPKRKADRRRHEARRDRSFLEATLSA
jgi:hypothetical protein